MNEPLKAHRVIQDNSFKNIHTHSDSYIEDTKSAGEDI